MLPCATYYKRQGYPLKKIVQYAANRDFTDLMVREDAHVAGPSRGGRSRPGWLGIRRGDDVGQQAAGM